MNQIPGKVLLRGKGVYGLIILALLAGLLGSAVTPVQAAATSWYVDSSAAGSGTGTSWANAWKSLSAIKWTQINPGDKIFISGGTSSKTYSGGIEFSRSGSSGAPITIDKGANSPSPSGHSGSVIINGGSYCLLSKGSYVTIRNLVCQNATSSGFRVEGTGVIVEFNVIRNSYSQGIHVHYCTNCVVRANRITTSDNIAQQTDGIVIYESSSTIVEYNWVKITNQNNCGGCHNDGIQASTKLGANYSNINIRFNYVENTKASTNNAQGIYLTQMKGSVYIIGNVVNVPYGNQAVVSRLYNNGAAVSVNVIGNTIKNGGYYALRVEDDNPVIKNNIIWQTGGGDPYIKGGAIVRLDGRSSGASKANIDYNLMYAPYTSNSAFNRDGSGTSWSTWQSNGFDAHGLFQNPGLDSCFRPTSGSLPSVNRGVSLGIGFDYAISSSLCGQNGAGYFYPSLVSRSGTGSSGWDIGAYEYSGAAAAPTAVIPTPTATRPAVTATLPAPTATLPAPTATLPAAPTATQPVPVSTQVGPTATQPAPTGSSVTLLPLFDTYVDKNQPTFNFGTSNVLTVDSSPRAISYLRFDVQGLQGHAIKKATLRLYVLVKGNSPVEARGNNSDGKWTETDLTYATAPIVSDEVDRAEITFYNIWIELDVTDLITGEGMKEISLANSGDSATQFASRENTEFAPKLVIELQ